MARTPGPEVARLLAKLRNVTETTTGWLASCPVPGHGKGRGDINPSLAVNEGEGGKLLVCCHHPGCNQTEVWRVVRELMGDGRESQAPSPASPGKNRAGRPPRPRHPLTVEALAASKGLPVELLHEVGVEQNGDEVKITYRLEGESTTCRQRRRLAAVANQGSEWEKGTAPIVPYGLWFLDGMQHSADVPEDFRGKLVLVEGESDCWTLWKHFVPALGIPGANMAAKLQKSHIEGFGCIYIFREPDTGGTGFLAGLARRLHGFGYTGEVRMIVPAADDGKDPNELYRRDPNNFLTRWRQLVASAKEVDIACYVRETERAATSSAEPRNPNPPAGPAASRPVPVVTGPHWLTDTGNAERLVARHGQDLHCVRHDTGWGHWLAWDGRRWAPDDTGEVERRAKESALQLYAIAAGIDGDKEREAVLAAAKRALSVHGRRAAVELARSEPGMAVSMGQLDADPWALTCLNGTLDLRTGRLRPHRREDLVTKLAPVLYDPTARMELWGRFLREATGGDEDLERFLARVAGYALTGSTAEEAFFFVHGPTATGKSTFLEALKAALGDYARTADFEAFVARKDAGGPRPEIARLAGARLVVSIEVDRGKRLAEGLVKQLTGGDTVSARFLYQSEFEFAPQFKLFLAANDAPRIRDDDEALWRRILRVPFEVQVPAERRDPEVKATLRNPALAGPAILAWAMRGCLEWQEHGLGVPQAVEEATAELRTEMDPLAEWIGECCTLVAEAWTSSAELRESYERWARENGVRNALGGKAFAERLRARGCEGDRNRYRGRGWRGIGLVDARREEERRGDERRHNMEGGDDDSPF